MSDLRTIIVTGASSGIGHALAIAAASEGFRVAIAARRGDRLEEVAQSIRSKGGSCITIVGDIRTREMPPRIVDETMRAFGRIDVVVNNAGGGAYGPLLSQSEAEIDAQWQLNVLAPLRLARAALPHLRKTHGQIVFLGSGIARVPLPLYGAYAPAKAAIRAAATQLRLELRGDGIAVTYVDPGLVATEFHIAMGVERAKEVAPASPERVAHAILRGIARRSATVNAVPWQSAGTIIGEWFGSAADSTIIARFTPQQRTEAARADKSSASVSLIEHVSPVSRPDAFTPSLADSSPVSSSDSFEKALEPVERRMERVKLSPTFMREALVPGATLELNELAMRWAGMPNKNERAAMREVLEALAASGYLEPMEDETWKVLRAAE